MTISEWLERFYHASDEDHANADPAILWELLADAAEILENLPGWRTA